MDGLVSSILASDEFLATARTGSYINAQSLQLSKYPNENLFIGYLLPTHSTLPSTPLRASLQ